MIDWDKTFKEFGISNEDIKSSDWIYVKCDKCNESLKRRYKSYKNILNKNGYYHCITCSRNKDYKWDNYEFLYKNYVLKGRSIERLRKRLHVNTNNLTKILKKYNIKLRTIGESVRLLSDGSRKRAKKLWNNEKYRDKISKSTKDNWDNNEKFRNIIIKQNRNKWNDENFRAKVSNSIKKLHQDRIYKSKYAAAMNKLNNDIEHKEKLSIAIKKLWSDNEYRKKMHEIFDNDEYKLNLSRKMREIFDDDKLRLNLSVKIRKIWLDEEFRKRMAVARSQQPRVSSIQTILYSILDDLGIKYCREHKDKSNDPETVIGYYNFDCVIPREGKPDLLIECQGDYWHNQDKAIKRDKAKSTYIKKYFPQYELKYLWEHEFSCKEKIVEVIKYWLGITELELVDFNFKDVDIRDKVKSDDYKLLLSKYHYLPNAGRGGRVYGAYFNNELIAVCVFSSLVRHNIRTNDYDPGECLELSRFCVHPRYQKKNFGSWFISRCLKLLDSKYQLIISYCDKTFNHDGALYKACNFKEDGIIKSDYWYVDGDGYVMHKKTLYSRAVKMNMKESDFAEQYGYRRVYGDEKIRFIYER